MAPKIQVIINAKNVPRIIPYLIPNFLTSDVTLSYLSISSFSLVKDFTLVIPVKDSDTIIPDSAILS